LGGRLGGGLERAQGDARGGSHPLAPPRAQCRWPDSRKDVICCSLLYIFGPALHLAGPLLPLGALLPAAWVGGRGRGGRQAGLPVGQKWPARFFDCRPASCSPARARACACARDRVRMGPVGRPERGAIPDCQPLMSDEKIDCLISCGNIDGARASTHTDN
jgi:hypothetical protein